MESIDETCAPPGDAVAQSGLSGLFTKVTRSLFGHGDILDGPAPGNERLPETRTEPRDDLGWLSLTLDADGHSPHEQDVLCLGLTPDDFGVHDPDGGDLSWIGLSPVKRYP
jgi:hypothetical protein